jgi:beta-N-acetylhexosaminidase
MRLGGLFLTLGLVAGAVFALAAARPHVAASGPDPVVAEPVVDAADEADEPEGPACMPAPLAERAGQVLVVGLPDVTDPEHDLAHEVIDLGVAGIFLTQVNLVDAGQFRDLVATMRTRSAHPLIVSTDEETGRVSSFRALFGHTSSPRTQAVRLSPDDVRDNAEELGRNLADLGITLDFAPVADLDDGPAQAIIGDRSYSAQPETASEYALAFSRGLAAGGVTPTVKHFPGHGRSQEDTHSKLAEDDTPLWALMDSDLVPFIDQIEAGVPVVMLNHVTHTGIDPEWPASVSAETYQLLRELGFRGVAITDSVGMGAIHRRWKFDESAVLAITAGADAVLATDGNQARIMRDSIVAAVEDGTLPEERLNEAVARTFALRGMDAAEFACATAEDFPTLTPVPADIR